MFKHAVLLGSFLIGCTSETPSAGVRVSMSVAGTQAKAVAGITPTELSVKLGAIYVTEDVAAGTGNNIGATQAVYASPECDGIDGGDGTVQSQPNLGSCSIDVGMQSSSSPPQTITKSPRYIDLAAGTAAVDAALDAGRFGVAAGTYKYLRLDIGSNAPMGQFNGNQAVSPPGTAMNFRFQVPGMTAPFEIRRLVGVDVAFAEPLVITGSETVDIDVQYSLENVVYEPGSGAPGEEMACTPAGATRYCLNVSSIQFHPVLTVTPAAM
jgi:hypothetical protein